MAEVIAEIFGSCPFNSLQVLGLCVAGTLLVSAIITVRTAEEMEKLKRVLRCAGELQSKVMKFYNDL